MKKQFKVLLYLFLVVFLFSCGSIANKQAKKIIVSLDVSEQETNLSQSENGQVAEVGSTKLASDNFRNVKVGNIKEGILYRGASSIDNSFGRAKYVDKLIEEAGVKFDVDLTDNDEKIKRHFSKKDFASNNFKTLYESGKTVLLHMDTNYREQKYRDRVVKALTAMSKKDGPYYVHCVEGKNRTGFVMAVIEGLAGASYDEIVKDHMITFANYYGITEENDKEKYDILKARYIDSMLRFIADSDPWTGNGTIELRDLDWVNIMGRFLINNGMTEEDLHNWYEKLTDENYGDPN